MYISSNRTLKEVAKRMAEEGKARIWTFKKSELLNGSTYLYEVKDGNRVEWNMTWSPVSFFTKINYQTIDKWVSKYGANTPLIEVLLAIGWVPLDKLNSKAGKDYKFQSSKAEEDVNKKIEEQMRKKATDEVADVSDNPQEDSELHGGDGNSQEVDHESESQNPESEGSSKQSGEISQDDTEKVNEEILRALETLSGEDQEGNKQRKGYYNAMADKMLSNALKQGAQPSRSLRRVMKTMEQLFRQSMVRGDEESPRLRADRLVREIKTKRYAISRCHKNETGKLPVLIMVDISGSCSASAGGNLEAAILIQRKMQEDVTVVLHANGYPNVVFGQHLKLPENHGSYNCSQFDSVGFYTSQKWSMVINLGDQDADDEMQGIAGTGAKIVLIDSYSCKSAGKAFPMMKTGYPHIGGVNDTTDLWVALKIYKDLWGK